MHQGQPLALDETSHTKIKQKKEIKHSRSIFVAALDDYLIRKSVFKAKIIFWLANAPALQRRRAEIRVLPSESVQYYMG